MVGFRQKDQISDIFSPKTVLTKVLFFDGFTWQNFRLSLLRLVDRLFYTVIHKTQKTKVKVLSCETVGE